MVHSGSTLIICAAGLCYTVNGLQDVSSEGSNSVRITAKSWVFCIEEAIDRRLAAVDDSKRVNGQGRNETLGSQASRERQVAIVPHTKVWQSKALARPELTFVLHEETYRVCYYCVGPA